MNGVDFNKYFHSPEQLARKVLEVFFAGGKFEYPIDPFKLLDSFGVVYQFRNFDKLEGVYIVPESADDIAIVGINNVNRPITRQRFTAAHELCHHIKDRHTQDPIVCPSSGKNSVEQFADRFASALLMPIDELCKLVKMHEKEGWVDFENILYIADYFGVSFEACVYRVAYRLKKIHGDTRPSALRQRINKFKPGKKRQTFGIVRNIALLQDVVNSYKYSFATDSKAVWYKFKNDFVYNENRLEGLEIDKEDVAEIITDLRLHKQRSEYCCSEYKDIIEVAGHASLYEYVMTIEEPITAFKMLEMNRILFQYAPFPEEAGKIRTDNNVVVGASFEAADCKDIAQEFVSIDKLLQALITKGNELTYSKYIDEAVKIHHKVTIVHPFNDGNGRISRAVLNWLFKLKGLPPVYLKAESKENYLEALRAVDRENNCTKLVEIFYRQVLESMIQLNSTLF